MHIFVQAVYYLYCMYALMLYIDRSFDFEVKFLYTGNNIVLTINSSNDGIFCCQLDHGTCIRCKYYISNSLYLQVFR